MIIGLITLGGCAEYTESSTKQDVQSTLNVANNLAENQPTPTDIDYSLERYNLELQPRFLLQDGFSKNKNRYRKIEYVADFQYIENNKVIVEDVKGMQTEVFKIKRKLFEKKYPELELKIIY
jgi:hypothetical protein